jgi:hypothetical protein
MTLNVFNMHDYNLRFLLITCSTISLIVCHPRMSYLLAFFSAALFNSMFYLMFNNMSSLCYQCLALIITGLASTITCYPLIFHTLAYLDNLLPTLIGISIVNLMPILSVVKFVSVYLLAIELSHLTN